MEGSFLGIHHGAVVVVRRWRSDTLRIPRADVRRMTVARDQPRRFLHDATWGLVIGMGAGAIAGFLNRNDRLVADPGGFVLWTASIGGILGGLTGTLVAVKPRLQWVPVYAGFYGADGAPDLR
ncbi:MAG: hypothetical protein WD801_16215 [Gemmatimonadaceae bacterium]